MKVAELGKSIRYFDMKGLWKLVLDAERKKRNRSVYSDKFRKYMDSLDKETRFPVIMEVDHNDMAELRLQIGIDGKGNSIWLDCDFDLVSKVSHFTKA